MTLRKYNGIILSWRKKETFSLNKCAETLVTMFPLNSEALLLLLLLLLDTCITKMLEHVANTLLEDTIYIYRVSV